MQDTGKRVCPFCAGETPTDATLCSHCGRHFPSMRLARPKIQTKNDAYVIVPDGDRFAIAFRGEIYVGDLDFTDLEKARSTVAILNRFIADEKVG